MIRAIRRLFRRIFGGRVSDQTYYEASVDDKMRDRDQITDRIVGIARDGEKDNAKMVAAIEIVKSVSKSDVMAELVKGMKSR